MTLRRHQAIIVAFVAVFCAATPSGGADELDHQGERTDVEIRKILQKLDGHHAWTESDLDTFESLTPKAVPVAIELVETHETKDIRHRYYAMLAIMYGGFEGKLSEEQKEKIVTLLLRKTHTQTSSKLHVDLLSLKHVRHERVLEFLRQYLDHEAEYIRDTATKASIDIAAAMANSPTKLEKD